MPPTWPDRVRQQVRAVEATHQDALAALSSGWWTTTHEESAINAVKSLAAVIARWAERGTSAADAGIEPSNGWGKWIDSGTDIMNSIRELHQGGEHGFQEDLAYTAANAPAVSGAALQGAIEGAAKTARGAVEGLLGIPVWVLALGAVVVFVGPAVIPSMIRGAAK